jgi:hypothetical protein
MRWMQRSITAVTVAVTAAALAVVGGTAAANAATPVPASHGTYTHMCAAAKPGTRQCFALRLNSAGVRPSISPNATPSGFGPSQLQSAYALSSLVASGGSGTTVAIVDAYNDPDITSDLTTYRSQFGLPTCTTASGCFKVVNQNGATSPLPTNDTGWSGEIALDVEMVSASCPACHILLVEANSANNSDLDTAVNYAAAHAQIVSNSYGGSETSSDTSDSSYNHPGTLILASSGDEGYVVEFPASSPTVMAVGGTALKTASNSRGWTETVWNTSNSEGAGSGCSKYEAQPSWQTANTTIKSLCSKRAVADVSAVADPATGVAVLDSYGSGGWTVYGGTSVASPLVAGIFAVTGHASATPQFPYANSSDFYDVTSGQTSSSCTNALCKAQAGWDGPTGIGTPNGAAMAGSSPPPTNDFSVSVSPSSGSVTAGAGTSATVNTATTAGSAQTVSLSVSGAPSGVTASISPTSVTSGSSATLSISTTSSVTPGSYPLTITGSAASGSHTTTYTLTVNGSGGSCTTTTQKLTNPGFESGSTGWSSTSGVINTDGAYARTGKGYAWLDGYGTTHTDTLSQTVSVPSNACSATFSFWLYINTSETTTTTAYDKLTVSAGGTTLATYSNLNHSSGYVQKSFNLSAYAGQNVTLTFKGVEDSSLQTSFFVDDTAVNVVT